MIETYHNPAAGFSPILIRPGWQVGHLNFMPELRPGAIDRIERHRQTDEAFVLFKGAATLVAAIETGDGLKWEVVRMRQGVTYNIPGTLWHTIAMTPEDVVIIVEKDGTHLNDVEYRPLTQAERGTLQAALRQS